MSTININDLTLGQIKEIQSLTGSKNSITNQDNSHWEIGQNYFIRTVTMIQLGELKKVTDNELLLSKACWVADTGRLSESLIKGNFDEIEMFPNDADVIIGRGGLIDAVKVNITLPTETK